MVARPTIRKQQVHCCVFNLYAFPLASTSISELLLLPRPIFSQAHSNDYRVKVGNLSDRLRITSRSMLLGMFEDGPDRRSTIRSTPSSKKAFA